MRDPGPLDEETLAVLEAIDATLADEPVAPELADFAELSLLLRDERPQPDPLFRAGLDARVHDRFTIVAPRRRPRLRRAWWGTAGALAATAAAVLGLVLLVHASGPSGPSASSGSGVSPASSATAGAPKAASAGTASSSGASASHGSSTRVPPSAPLPRTGHGRDVTQSAQLALDARAGEIGVVAQEVFAAVGAEQGDVVSSHVIDRAGAAGSATFSLEIPSAHLQAALTRLSALPDARVSSREDASADITETVNTTAARLATAQALRRSLLRQLAAADTTSQVASLKGQLASNEATIVSLSGALAGLHAKVVDSAVAVTITSPAPTTRRADGGFTVHRALHDAGRILVVVAGVLLIALAVLVPLGLLVALGSWVWALTLRRRREGALGR